MGEDSPWEGRLRNLPSSFTQSPVTPKGFAPLSIFGTVQWFFVQNAMLGSVEMDLISVNKNPTTVMLTWDAATNVHCATGKVVCKRSCHVACQATTKLEGDLRFQCSEPCYHAECSSSRQLHASSTCSHCVRYSLSIFSRTRRGGLSHRERYVANKYRTSCCLLPCNFRMISSPPLSLFSHNKANKAELALKTLRISSASATQALPTVAEDLLPFTGCRQCSKRCRQARQRTKTSLEHKGGNEAVVILSVT